MKRGKKGVEEETKGSEDVRYVIMSWEWGGMD